MWREHAGRMQFYGVFIGAVAVSSVAHSRYLGYDYPVAIGTSIFLVIAAVVLVAGLHALNSLAGR